MSGAHVGHRRSPYRQWPVTGKTLKNHIFSTLFLNKSISKQQYCVFLIISNIKTLFVSNI